MKDFILNLFDDPNFPIYLGVIIVVLLVLFFIVFFLGKKDKKEFEKTQKLQKIANENITSEAPNNNDVNTIEQNLTQMPDQGIGMVPPVNNEVAFKEETTAQPVEVPVSPVVTPAPVQNAVPVEPVIPAEPVQAPLSNPAPVMAAPAEPMQVQSPIPAAPEEKKASYDDLLNSIDKELKELEERQAMATIKTDEVVSAVPNVDVPAAPKVNNEVFSSVYAPKKETSLEQTSSIELPKLKSEEKPVLVDNTDDKLNI